MPPATQAEAYTSFCRTRGTRVREDVADHAAGGGSHHPHHHRTEKAHVEIKRFPGADDDEGTEPDGIEVGKGMLEEFQLLVEDKDRQRHHNRDVEVRLVMEDERGRIPQEEVA